MTSNNDVSWIPCRVGRVSLKGFSTAELVAELSKRKGVVIEDLINPADIYPWYVIHHEFEEYHKVSGPVKILMVQQ